jgi:hypothetical protein
MVTQGTINRCVLSPGNELGLQLKLREGHHLQDSSRYHFSSSRDSGQNSMALLQQPTAEQALSHVKNWHGHT